MRGGLAALLLASAAGGARGAPPAVELASPAPGSSAAGPVVVSAAVKGEAARVQFKLDGADLGGPFTDSPYSFLWDAARAAPGAHVLSVEAFDAAGGRSVSQGVPVTVEGGPPPDTMRPTVWVTAPTDGALVWSTVTLKAEAIDDKGVAAVQFRLDGKELGPRLVAPPYSWAWNSAFAPGGPHRLSAVAWDAAGNAATATVAAVTVDNAPPVVGPVSAEDARTDGAVIRWATDRRADSQVEYGMTADYGSTTRLNPSLFVRHEAALSGLSPETLYHYRVRSRGPGGLLGVSEDFTFATAEAAPAGAASAPAALPAAKAPQRVLSPALADGINDSAVFGPDAQEVSVFDLRGRPVYRAASPGPASPLSWDCRDASGRIVPSGVYVARVLTRGGQRLYQTFAVAK